MCSKSGYTSVFTVQHLFITNCVSIMKNFTLRFTLLISGTLLLLLSSCIQDKCEQSITYITLVPAYISYEDLRSEPVISEAARELAAPGKMYFYNNFIFISELNEGIHVVDNSNPSNPQRVSFINIPGNRDIAVKGNMLYADSYVDLLIIDISDPQNVNRLGREKDVFPYDNWHNGFVGDPALGIVRNWNEEEVTEMLDCNVSLPSRGGVFFANDMLASNLSSDFGSANAQGNFTNATNPGLGGSLARFAIVGDVFYAVTDEELINFSLNNPANPAMNGRFDVGFGIETIFPYKDHLFIGSQTGMFIYDITSPESPAYVSEFVHARNCDPVVVEDDRAYVTLRSGSLCPGDQNQLDVIDISNLSNPRIITSHDFVNPNGLGIRDDVLFICDGEAGLKVFDAKDDWKILDNEIAHYPSIQATDVIPLPNGILLMIGEDGFYQYDYSDVNNITLLSKIEVKQ